MPSKQPEPPRCPYCGEEKLIDIEGFKLNCDVCGRSSALPAKKIDVPVKGNP